MPSHAPPCETRRLCSVRSYRERRYLQLVDKESTYNFLPVSRAIYIQFASYRESCLSISANRMCVAIQAHHTEKCQFRTENCGYTCAAGAGVDVGSVGRVESYRNRSPALHTRTLSSCEIHRMHTILILQGEMGSTCPYPWL